MKRTFTTLVLVALIAISASAFALMPSQHTTAPADSDSYAELTDFGLPYLFSEECPGPNDTGCGG